MNWTPTPALVERCAEAMYAAQVTDNRSGRGFRHMPEIVQQAARRDALACLTASGLGDAVGLLNRLVANYSGSSDRFLRAAIGGDEAEALIEARALLASLDARRPGAEE